MKEQLARGTPEGDLNASGRMQGFILDANSHGAGDNPNFMKKWDELEEKTNKLHASMHAAGKSTEEYDQQISSQSWKSRTYPVTDSVPTSRGNAILCSRIPCLGS